MWCLDFQLTHLCSLYSDLYKAGENRWFTHNVGFVEHVLYLQSLLSIFYWQSTAIVPQNHLKQNRHIPKPFSFTIHYDVRFLHHSSHPFMKWWINTTCMFTRTHTHHSQDTIMFMSHTHIVTHSVKMYHSSLYWCMYEVTVVYSHYLNE